MRINWRDTWPAFVVLTLSILLTLFATQLVSSNVQSQNRAEFDESVQALNTLIQRRMTSYTNLLVGARGLFAATPDVTPTAWRRYIGAYDLAQRFPGVQGIGFAGRMGPGEADGLQARLRRDGFVKDATIHPAGDRPESYPILLLEPMDARNRVAIGYDMYSEPTRRAAMAQARDTGAPAITDRLTLVQEITPEKQAGFLLYVPVYRTGTIPPTETARRAALTGFVYAPFRAGDLFSGLFESQLHNKLDVWIYDGPAEAADRLLYHEPTTRQGAYSPLYRQLQPIDVAGHTWTLVVTAPPAFGFDAPMQLPLYMLLAGLVTSMLLFTNAWVLATGRQRAIAVAEGMTSELRQADRAKDEFLSVISHELRTPLNFIMGFASIMEDEIAGPLNAAQRDYMGKIMSGADRMLMLVNDLLDFAKLQAGKFSLSPAHAPYGPLVEETIASMRPLAAIKHQRLDSELTVPDTPLCVDAKRIGQVIYNLVSNAVKFTPDGGAIRVRAYVQGQDLVTEVTDTGIGIAEEDVPKLFTRFKQLDMSATRQAGGTGLGLSIAKALVEAHGGTIGVRSQPEVGSTFWFTLPLTSPLADCQEEP